MEGCLVNSERVREPAPKAFASELRKSSPVGSECFSRVTGFPFSYRQKPVPSRCDFDGSSRGWAFLSCSDWSRFVGLRWRRDKRKTRAVAVRDHIRYECRAAFCRENSKELNAAGF